MKKGSIGKIRGLQQCSTKEGKFSILALDHRNNLRRLLHPEDEKLTTGDEISRFKGQVVQALGEIPSAYLLDPLFGAAQSISDQWLPGRCGLLVAVEQTGYAGDPAARESRLLDNWSVDKVKRMGANGVKLLVYYHPQSKTHKEIEDLVEKTAADCIREDIPFFLEILTYPLDPAKKGLQGRERREVVIESAKRLTPLGVDVLKAEFPLDIESSPAHSEWEAACRELSAASQAPWILLSSSIDFEVYKQQVEIACRAGASGVAVGRAVWKEAAGMPEGERASFLEAVSKTRMQEVGDIVALLAEPWMKFYECSEVDDGWYQCY
jgi:tagatose 1,6-diphosphate aldolase